MKEPTRFRKMRIKAGFKTAKEAAEHTKTPYRTWQKWENGDIEPSHIAYAYMDLYTALKILTTIQTKKEPVNN